jgi:hypothetical protein
VFKHLLLALLFLGLPLISFAQVYTPDIIDSKLAIEGANYHGYLTYFDRKVGTVKKELWTFCNQFGHLTKKEKYYTITLSKIYNEGNVDLTLFVLLSGEDDKSSLSIALNTVNLPQDKLPPYHEQTKTLLLNFKKTFYQNIYQKYIDNKIQNTKKLSRKYKKLSRHPDQELAAYDTMKQIASINTEIQQLVKKIKALE